jgi:hypothetical protein
MVVSVFGVWMVVGGECWCVGKYKIQITNGKKWGPFYKIYKTFFVYLYMLREMCESGKCANEAHSQSSNLPQT